MSITLSKVKNDRLLYFDVTVIFGGSWKFFRVDIHSGCYQIYRQRKLPAVSPCKVKRVEMQLSVPVSRRRSVGDSAFLEKRRKGLSRFINAIVRHPTLRNDDVVIKFLTEPAVSNEYFVSFFFSVTMKA